VALIWIQSTRGNSYANDSYTLENSYAIVAGFTLTRLTVTLTLVHLSNLITTLYRVLVFPAKVYGVLFKVALQVIRANLVFLTDLGKNSDGGIEKKES
jgi:hypothetical protein